MKIERKGKEFPITMTIETQAELDALWIGMNNSDNSFSDNGNSLLARGNSFDIAKNTYPSIWFALDDIR